MFAVETGTIHDIIADVKKKGVDEIVKLLNIEGCDPFVTKELSKDYYSWTLASLLRTMLQSAEELFGERNREFTILGVDFEVSGPNICFSGGYDSKYIIIRLSLNAQTNMNRACYQMAHETVHLLAPVEKEKVNNLEEG